MDKRITCSDCPLNGVETDELCEGYCSDMADFIDEIKANAIEDCILEIDKIIPPRPYLVKSKHYENWKMKTTELRMLRDIFEKMQKGTEQ